MSILVTSFWLISNKQTQPKTFTASRHVRFESNHYYCPYCTKLHFSLIYQADERPYLHYWKAVLCHACVKKVLAAGYPEGQTIWWDIGRFLHTADYDLLPLEVIKYIFLNITSDQGVTL